MKVQRIDFDRATEQPAVVTVEMTVDEAAFIAKLIGAQGKPQMGLVVPERLLKHVDPIWYALTRNVFNPYWDDGLDDYIRETGEAE